MKWCNVIKCKFRIKEHKQYIQKQENNKCSIAKHCWEMNRGFGFNSDKIISKPASIHKFTFLEAFNIYKNFDNILLIANSLLLLYQIF